MTDQNLPLLNRKLLFEKYLGADLANYPAALLDYPERVIQFGEGNFLRAFVDWMFHRMNQTGVFQGRVVVVQPIAQGRIKELNQQDCLYTLISRGNRAGKVTNQREIIPVISRGLSATAQWEEVLRCATDPKIEIIVSNTTEAGIAYHAGDQLTQTPPVSFPAKITAYLYRRFQHFQGDSAPGMIIIPCELIDRNGDNLKKLVLRYAAEWNLPESFSQWVNCANHFLNTLVDRIVTGYPAKEAAELETGFGYRDQNLNTCEIFHSWVIEGDSQLAAKLPFHKAGLDVKWVANQTPYRTRKVWILNGAHTATVALACLSNIAIVRDTVNDPALGQFMREVLSEEIIPALNMEKHELTSFAAAVLERFNNPFIDHKWSDIAFNSTSKFTARVMPPLLAYLKKQGKMPERLTLSLAALIALYRGTEIRDAKLVGHSNGNEYLIRDDLETLEFFRNIWREYEAGTRTIAQVTAAVLNRFWPESIAAAPDLTTAVTAWLADLLNLGVAACLEKCRLGERGMAG
jgi:tagaturonate reductase